MQHGQSVGTITVICGVDQAHVTLEKVEVHNVGHVHSDLGTNTLLETPCWSKSGNSFTFNLLKRFWAPVVCKSTRPLKM